MGKSKNTSFYIHSAICVAIMVAFQFLPPVGQITALGMKVLGIYIGLLYGWSTVSLIWPSFLGLFFLAFSGYDTVGHLITSGFGNATNVYIMLICVFSFFVTQSGVSGIIVRAIIGRKFASGRPWIISGLFLTAAYACGALISMTPACIIVWSIVCQYCKDLGYKNVHVGTVEAYPSLESALRLIRVSGVKEIRLAPFMVVAGDHAINDMAGEEEESWKSRLEAEGYSVSGVINGLGEYREIQNLYAEHAKNAKPL